jgi:hypothetical protein
MLAGTGVAIRFGKLKFEFHTKLKLQQDNRKFGLAAAVIPSRFYWT